MLGARSSAQRLLTCTHGLMKRCGSMGEAGAAHDAKIINISRLSKIKISIKSILLAAVVTNGKCLRFVFDIKQKINWISKILIINEKVRQSLDTFACIFWR